MADTVQKLAATQRARLKLTIRGAVQGVGFRPFVYRLASELELTGWVNNTAQGVFIEVEGTHDQLEQFLLRVAREKPAISFIQSLESSYADAVGYTTFEIRHSEGGAKSALVMPDIATCPECLAEISDSANRRYRYPFTNCTNCGPRYSILESLPYDRPRTTMRQFAMCPECAREYGDPRDRRFHAQPNACPVCGPHLELWTMTGAVAATHDEALVAAAAAIRAGQIVGVKGLGGFHLLADAGNEATVDELRRRKHREEKPFALMFPTLAALEQECAVSPLEQRLLLAPESPIVLLDRRDFDRPNLDRQNNAATQLAPSVAPDNPLLGAMLPYTPLHHLLLAELHCAVVATSGNLSDEPICIDEHEALERLAGIADLLLVHNRPILRHVDDSMVRVMCGREMVLRRARGYAPLPIMLDEELPPLLGVGAHQKNAVALSVGRQVFISQHIGDLETESAGQAFARVIENLETLYETKPEIIACDLHPNYVSSEYAAQNAAAPLRVQHHYAHALSCLAENGVPPPALALTWDGSGWGPDGTVWGGEFLKIDECGYKRIARLRPFALVGSEKAVREPRRCGLSLLWETFGEDALHEKFLPTAAFSAAERRVVAAMLRQGLNSPQTSSMGRLFDGVASLIGLRQKIRHEGQAAMALEWLAASETNDDVYPFALQAGENAAAPAELDWRPMVEALVQDVARGETQARMARRFHRTLAEMAARVARELAPQLPVALSGGCFQNRLLTEMVMARLKRDGIRVYWHQRVPPNDGGIALGQIVAAARAWKQRRV